MNKTKTKKEDLRVSGGDRLSRIAALGETVFHAGDAANLWRITNKNSLNKTLSRYVSDGILHRIYKGFYSVRKVGDINPIFLGAKAINAYAYLSCESVLFQNGVLNQSPQEITFVSSDSKHFKIAGINYRSRRMSDEFLFNDVGVETKDGVRVATLSRAMADMLYFNPKKHFDVASTNLIDWGKVKEIISAVGYKVKIKS